MYEAYQWNEIYIFKTPYYKIKRLNFIIKCFIFNVLYMNGMEFIFLTPFHSYTVSYF